MRDSWTQPDLTTSLPNLTPTTTTMASSSTRRRKITARNATFTLTRDQMQAHKEGAKHRKMSAKVQRFRCDLCLIDVPCRDTLDNHMRGKDHIKRVKQLEEQRREKGVVVDEEGSSGYRTGPREMAKLEQTEREELEQLRKTVKTLRTKVQDQTKKLAKCRQEHGTADMVELRKKVSFFRGLVIFEF